MTFVLDSLVLAAAARHAKAEFPRESCGLVVGDAYWACENEAQAPTEAFVVPDAVMARAEATGALRAIVHSHPGGPSCPSASDMIGQAGLDLPYVIVPLDFDAPTGEFLVHDPIVFGDCLGIAPVIGRSFVHGWHDCFAIIRDCHRLGHDALADQGVDWPHPPIEVPDFPRDLDWWTDGRLDLYRDGFAAAGFREIATADVRPGDVFLAATPGRGNPKRRLNHGGVLLSNELILHHLPTRLSQRTSAGNWLPAIQTWVRHESVLDA